jgi:hypothetical protein
MHVPRECYQIEGELVPMLPALRPAQRRTLALWVFGTLVAGRCTQNAVLAALVPYGRWHTIRDRLREWLYDGAERAAPCKTTLDVTTCFAPLLRWILARWQGTDLALAIDVTYRGGDLTVLTVSVLYRGSAIPVAWHITRCNTPGAWTPLLVTLVSRLAPAVPSTLRVLVLLDRGLRMRELWRAIRQQGWHLLVRQRGDLTFRPAGYRARVAARSLVPGPGHAWVGAGTACKHKPFRRQATLIVVWAERADDPWVLLTDLPPSEVGVWWYGVRMWIELGFRALKGLGWDWEHTRRLDPERAARHWLVLAVAAAWVLAYATRVEDSQTSYPLPCAQVGVASQSPRLRRPVSLFRLGTVVLLRQIFRGRLWRRLSFRPEPWPHPPDTLQITIHRTPI